jgi:16S rRNA (guanine527-N7)-methyltransferase
VSQREQWYKVLRGFSEKIDLSLDEEQIDQLIHYLDLLIKWNKAFNLTSVRDPDNMLYRHLIDSLSVAPCIKGNNIADVGTGPGLPGIPLSIIYPEKHFTLMDSNGKKTRFLTQCVLELNLQNVQVENLRVEAFKPSVLFDQVVSRAFSALVNMTNWCEHLLSRTGEFVAMKGQYPHQEIEDLPAHIKVKKIQALELPGNEGERHLVLLEFVN